MVKRELREKVREIIKYSRLDLESLNKKTYDFTVKALRSQGREVKELGNQIILLD